jgi:hypothetical protein
MINWLKKFFEIKPGEGVVPISSKDADEAYAKRIQKETEREWIYMGDGMMEEVIRPATKAGEPKNSATVLKASGLKNHISNRNSGASAYGSRTTNTTSISSTDIATMTLVYSAYSSGSVSSDSGSSYDSGSCDSGSSSCN